LSDGYLNRLGANAAVGAGTLTVINDGGVGVRDRIREGIVIQAGAGAPEVMYAGCGMQGYLLAHTNRGVGADAEHRTNHYQHGIPGFCTVGIGSLQRVNGGVGRMGGGIGDGGIIERSGRAPQVGIGAIAILEGGGEGGGVAITDIVGSCIGRGLQDIGRYVGPHVKVLNIIFFIAVGGKGAVGVAVDVHIVPGGGRILIAEQGVVVVAIRVKMRAYGAHTGSEGGAEATVHKAAHHPEGVDFGTIIFEPDGKPGGGIERVVGMKADNLWEEPGVESGKRDALVGDDGIGPINGTGGVPVGIYRDHFHDQRVVQPRIVFMSAIQHDRVHLHGAHAFPGIALGSSAVVDGIDPHNEPAEAGIVGRKQEPMVHLKDVHLVVDIGAAVIDVESPVEAVVGMPVLLERAEGIGPVHFMPLGELALGKAA